MTLMTAEQAALEQAIEILGGQNATSRVLSVPQSTVHYRLHTAKCAPAEWCAPIERATGGKVSRAMLRPDLFGDLVKREDVE